MSCAVLSEHQTEAATTAAPAETEGGGHDEAEDGSDEREDEPRRPVSWRGRPQWQGQWRGRRGQHSSVHPAAGKLGPWQTWHERPAKPGSDGRREEGKTSKCCHLNIF